MTTPNASPKASNGRPLPNCNNTKTPKPGRSVPGSSLVLDGSEVKLRLQAERSFHKTPVHVDWVRFTCLLRNVASDFKTNFGPVLQKDKWANYLGKVKHGSHQFNYLSEGAQTEVIRCVLEGFEKERRDPTFSHAAGQALELAKQVTAALGPDFFVSTELKKGHDFYKFRYSIERNGAECAWIGFLSSGDSPRQKAQAATVHANIYGHACTFAAPGWNHRLADVIDNADGKLTRADLALDFFDGLPGGRCMEAIREEYNAGLMDSNGKRLTCNMVGNWSSVETGSARSFYIGSKEAGKQTNIYEKGDQLFGVDKGSRWIRIELRYGNKLRFLDTQMLRAPADFFAGASDWHAHQMVLADAIFTAQVVKTTKALASETVLAEVSKNVNWLLTVAAPSMAAAWDFVGEQFLELVTNKKRPGRLQKFNQSELASAFQKVFQPGIGAGPSFALSITGLRGNK